jgi:hypothetical protein
MRQVLGELVEINVTLGDIYFTLPWGVSELGAYVTHLLKMYLANMFVRKQTFQLITPHYSTLVIKSQYPYV